MMIHYDPSRSITIHCVIQHDSTEGHLRISHSCQEFWERQRSVLERLRMLAPGLDEILTGASWLSVIGHRATNSDGASWESLIFLKFGVRIKFHQGNSTRACSTRPSWGLSPADASHTALQQAIIAVTFIRCAVGTLGMNWA